MVAHPSSRAASPAPSERTLAGSPSAAPAALFPPLPAFSAGVARDSMELYGQPAPHAACAGDADGHCWHCLTAVTLSRGSSPAGPARPALRRASLPRNPRRRVAFHPAPAVFPTWSPEEYDRGCARTSSFDEGDSDSECGGDDGVPSAKLQPPARSSSSATLAAFSWLEEGGEALPDLRAFWQGKPVAA